MVYTIHTGVPVVYLCMYMYVLQRGVPISFCITGKRKLTKLKCQFYKVKEKLFFDYNDFIFPSLVILLFIFINFLSNMRNNASTLLYLVEMFEKYEEI